MSGSGASHGAGPDTGQDGVDEGVTSDDEGVTSEGVTSGDNDGVSSGDGRAAAARTQRSWPGVVLRAVVVLVVAGVGYQLVVPTTSTVRSRLSRLVATSNGTATFAGAPSHGAEEPATNGNLAPLVAASKVHPGQTGLYVAQWTAKSSQSDGLAVVTFLLPDAATAAKARAQLASSQLSAKALSSSGLSRTAQFTPSGVPGAAGSLFGAAKGATAPGQAALVVWQQGRVVVLVEVALVSGSPQADATAATQAEAAHLRTVLPGFSLSVTRYPTTASIVWIVGSVVVLLLVAGGPVAWRRRRERRERRIQEELERTIRVRGATIVRKRSGA
jgi:hypothetical protein